MFNRMNTPFMNTSFFRHAICFLILLGCISTARAQDYKYEIGGMAGGAYYMGDLNKNAFFKGLNPSLGVVFRYIPNFRKEIKTDLLWGRVSGSTDGTENVFPNNATASFSRNFFELGGQMEFNFMPYSDKFVYLNTKRFSPYIFLGAGVTIAPGNQTFASLNIPMGVGVKYKLKSRLNLGCEFSFRKLFGDSFDVTDGSNEILDNPYGISSSAFKNKDWYSLLMISITWDFGERCRPCNNKYSNGAY